jgi:queuine tRNA-ribosyltransferase
LRHLFLSQEILGARLNTIHNLRYYMRLMEKARAAIEKDEWPRFRDQQLAIWTQTGRET